MHNLGCLTEATNVDQWLCLSRVHGREAEDGAFGAAEAGRCSCWSRRLPGPPPPPDCSWRRSAGEQRAAVARGDLRWHHACPPCSSGIQCFCVSCFLEGSYSPWSGERYCVIMLQPLMTLCVSFVPAGPSWEAVTTCAVTALFLSPEGGRGVDRWAPYLRKFVCCLTRQVRASTLNCYVCVSQARKQWPCSDLV